MSPDAKASPSRSRQRSSRACESIPQRSPRCRPLFGSADSDRGEWCCHERLDGVAAIDRIVIVVVLAVISLREYVAPVGEVERPLVQMLVVERARCGRRTESSSFQPDLKTAVPTSGRSGRSRGTSSRALTPLVSWTPLEGCRLLQAAVEPGQRRSLGLSRSQDQLFIEPFSVPIHQACASCFR